jgi:hypothetical protein
MKRILFSILYAFLIAHLIIYPVYAANTCVIADGGGNYNSAGTWANCGGTYPQTGDLITATATSGNLVINVDTQYLGGFDLTNYTGTLSTSNSYVHMGSGNIVLPNGFTNNLTKAFRIHGDATLTVGNAQTVYIAETVESGAHLRLGSDITTTAAGTIYIIKGQLTTNNYNITTNVFGDHGTRTGAITLNLGSSAINCTLGTQPHISFMNGNMTISANTATITVNANTQTNGLGSADWNGATFVFNAYATDVSALTIGGNNTITNLTINGVDSLYGGLIAFNGNNTITGTFTASGVSQVKRPFIKSSAVGTARTLTMTGGTLTLQDVDLQDMAITGSPTINKTRVGDAGGNSGGATSTPKTVYLGAANSTSLAWTGNYWAASAEADYAARAAIVSLNNYPLSQDTVIIDNNSFNGTSKSIVIGNSTYNYRIGAIDASGLTSSNGLIARYSTYFGNLNLSGSGITITTYGSDTLSFDARLGNITITPKAATSWGATNITINSNGNSVLFGGNTSITGTTTLTKGTLDINGKTLTTGIFSSSNSNTRTLQDSAGNAKIVLNGLTGTIFDMATATNLTVSNSPDIDIGDSDNTLTGNVTFAGGGKTFGDFTVKKHAGDYDCIITGSNTFGALTLETPDATYQYSDLQLTSGTTTTVSSLVSDGTASYKIGLKAVTGGSAATISDTTGANTLSNTTIQDITATGGAVWSALTTSGNTDVSGNTGWTWITASGIPAGLFIGRRHKHMIQ